MRYLQRKHTVGDDATISARSRQCRLPRPGASPAGLAAFECENIPDLALPRSAASPIHRFADSPLWRPFNELTFNAKEFFGPLVSHQAFANGF